MTDQSVAPHVAARTPEHQQASADAANRLLDQIEAELDRLRRARPQLSERARKAGNILVAHLAGRPAMPVVRVRISASGKARFLFNSLSGNGAVYIVDPQSWSCTCPDYHRRGVACKHVLAGWTLQRVAQATPESAEADYQPGRAS